MTKLGTHQFANKQKSENSLSEDECKTLPTTAYERLRFNYFVYINVNVLICTCFVLLLFIFLTCSTLREAEDGSYSLGLFRYEKTKKWDYFSLCQLWPPASCISPKSQNCTIPSGVNFWTIHGLWPSKINSSSDPEFCNKTWKFDIDQIQSIKDEMNINWPDCFDDDPVINFWKHEWEKHGTCAATVPTVDSQLKYFSKALELHSTYNISKMMAEAGYKPNEGKKILLADLLDKLQHSVGKKVLLKCVLHKKAVAPLLWSFSICFDKNFDLIDCNSSDTNCDEDSVLYWPFSNATQQEVKVTKITS